MPSRLAPWVSLALAVASPVLAQEGDERSSPWADPESPWDALSRPAPYSLLVFDSPHTLQKSALTWEQSLQIHQLSIVLEHRLLDPLPAGGLLEFLLHFALEWGYAPTGVGWLHNQAQLAVLARHRSSGISGFGCELGTVCGFYDDQLAAIHDSNPADWIRLEEAGVEAELETITSIRRQVFFYDQSTRPYLTYLMAQYLKFGLVIWFGMMVQAGGMGSGPIDSLPPLSNSDPTGRGIAGFLPGGELAGWGWDLARPRAPYIERGQLPGGRIRRTPDFTPLGWSTRFWKSVLIGGVLTYFSNILDISTLWNGVHRVYFPSPFGGVGQATFGLQGYLTETGIMLETRGFFRQRQWNVETALQAYASQGALLPGWILRVNRYPLQVGPTTAHLTAEIAGWLQPRDHDPLTTQGAPGGAITVDAALPAWTNFEVFLRARAKTSGWMVGDPDLDRSLQVGVGLNWLL